MRLGRGPQSRGAAHPGEDNRQTGVAGNTIFFAQPTAQVPDMMQLPPEEGDLVDSVNILFTRSTQQLDDAEWAQVNRAEYLELIQLRKKRSALPPHMSKSITRGPNESCRKMGYRHVSLQQCWKWKVPSTPLCSSEALHHEHQSMD